tara:strand:+ start:2790 stop:3653 length:864 start_codon:yes stop_codon:yes gene_type:complete
MSTQITTAFVQQFSSNITLLSTQKGSRLRGSVDEESVTGEKAFFDQIGSVAAIERTSRHGDTPLVETPHSRRMVTMKTFEWADLIDDADKVRLLADPTSVYAKTAANALGKAMDDQIISAATGSAATGKAGASSTSMLAANQIAHGSADLTIAKLISAKEILDAADVDPDIPRYIAVAPAQISALLGTTQVTSSDFNSVKALAQGQVDSFMGFKFIISNRLSVASSIRKCFAWAEDGLKLAVGKDVMAKIDERADKSYSTQVYYCATFGATRMEEAKIVEINCDESA